MADIQSLAQNASLQMRPAAGVEWTIHNLAWEIPSGGTLELRKSNGTIVARYESDSSSGGRFAVNLDCNNTVWYELKNTSATAITIIASYDGRQVSV